MIPATSTAFFGTIPTSISSGESPVRWFLRRMRETPSLLCFRRFSSSLLIEMKPKILLTGKNGQLGDDLQRMLPRLGDVVATDREQLDLSRAGEIRKLIRA